MNPLQSHYPNPPFTSFPPVPNPNVNLNPFFNPVPNAYHSIPQNPPPPNPPPTAPDLSSTLANLKSLITLSEQALTSISTLLPPEPQNGRLVPCPFNPHHRMTPESLFSHHLRCPFPLELGHAVESLNYPKTLKSSDELAKENRFVQALRDPDADLCFTLDDYTDFRESLNFSYKGCPGVVSFPSEDSSTKRTFTLPSSLSVECANFVTDPVREIEESVDKSHLLPSEFWSVRNEIEVWNEYPVSCSYHVVCAISSMEMVTESNLRKLAIVNSPKFGVVLDVAMGDHVLVLLSLCLKAIVKEGLSLVKSRSSTKFNCPVLVQVVMWFASQLSILYGDMCGKFFAIDLLKKCILDAASWLLLHSSERKVGESRGENNSSQDIDVDARDVDVEESVQEKDSRGVSLANTDTNSRVIFVSQVAAAIAALHERAALELKIRALRQPQQSPRYQRLMEHADVSKRAEDERRKRADYRAIIDHDGLPRQPASMQDSDKTKTREELLAEERDYKRRRMSYRGKKSKRNPSEVLRDIIGDFMEEIKQAGGIGCFEKAPADGILLHEPSLSSDLKRRNIDEVSGSTKVGPSHSRIYIEQGRGPNLFDDTRSKYEQPRKYQKHTDNQRRGHGRERLDKDYYSQSPERSSYSQSRDHNGYRKESNSKDIDKSKHRDSRRLSSDRYSYREYGSSSSRDYINEDRRRSKTRDRGRGVINGSYSSDFENTFEDRYDPSRSSDLYEDEAA